MSVRIIIVRHVPKEKAQDLKPLLLQMRSLANAQTGYISGETLVNYDDPSEHLVISTWKTLADWNTWLDDPQRRKLQSKVDEITGSETMYSVYYNG
ncbi:Heme-degrading monooxygenase HmoA [Malonomonas rubra DSM 5091]|uniref:Heme-degrading monooxygenase HmoA n=1 Tax=Malonomonas rubra DSM 5091 TaxID=1122189 RepID=A0A1M6G7S1_MALRU|nr:antibiotic biosynthesis monooxygenase [Malonomonas rubra]SHJ05982.1 Heme-degrading monooxygenase HmoA [Malonomonas rubra DSM 5091]